MENTINNKGVIPLLIAIYARVSTAKQEEEETIKNQLGVIQEFAEKNNYRIVQKYIDDGWSGDMLARPALDQLREDAKKKIWKAVLIYDPDRLARRYSYQELVMDELRDLGLETIFITTPSPKTGEEKILYGVKGLFAEYERVKITERFRLGKIRKAKEGHLVVSEAPYGYKYIPKQEGKHGYYEINKQEAEVVKTIFSWVADEGLTLRSVVKRLHEFGILPRKSKRGVWNTSTLTSLLRNKTYIGEARYGSSYSVVPENPLKKDIYRKIKKTSRRMRPEDEWIKIPAPAILEEVLFLRAAKQLKSNFDFSRRNKKNEYLLAGRIYCVCGSRRAGEGPQHGKHLYYRCTDRVLSFPLPSECNERGINARIADKLVWEKIKEFMTSPELLMNQVKQWLNKQHVKAEKSDFSVIDLQKEIGKLKKEEDRYLRAYGAELITMEKLKEYTNDLRNKISSIENQISHIKGIGQPAENIKLPTDEDVKEFCKKASEVLCNLNFELKKQIISNVVEKVIGTKERLLVQGCLPVDNHNYVKMCSLDRYGANTTRHDFSKIIPFEFRIKINSNIRAK
ncbi:MAG: recombinase family protein [Candidatus Omnitrophota bacterium]|jgi:site-specific DNA recombinase